MDYVSNSTVEAVAEQLREASGSILVLTHAKPDGDAAGSMSALVSALRRHGKSVRGLLVGPVSRGLLGVPGVSELSIMSEDDLDPPSVDLMVIVDTGAWSQLGDAADFVKGREADTIVIDHHLSGDVEAETLLIDSSAAAVAEVVARVMKAMADSASSAPSSAAEERLEAITPGEASALYAGLAADTGWFKFSNVTPATLRLAADLIEAGAAPTALYEYLEQAERVEKLALLTRAVESLTLLADGRAAVMTLTRRDFEETGALEEETERLVNIPLQVASVQVVVLAAESVGKDGNVVTKLSFRSKPAASPAAPETAVDVAALAKQFDGGGHARAAGARIEGEAVEVMPGVEAAVKRAIEG